MFSSQLYAIDAKEQLQQNQNIDYIDVKIYTRACICI